MEEEDEEDPELDQALEEELYRILEEKLAQIDRLPEPEPIVYPKGDPRWEQFGILLSGIISHLNDHRLDGMDVEKHIPVMEQQIASLVRRSWGISGRGELLDTIRYLTKEGYVLRCRLYGEASSPEALMEESDDEEACASVCRGWRFAQWYKLRFGPEFLVAGMWAGRPCWHAGAASWAGSPKAKALGILWELSQKAAEELHSWREFAESYLLGGMSGNCSSATVPQRATLAFWPTLQPTS